ncbi:hypothetical protein EEL30_05410 [Brevibacillus laterosporus]|uniref:PepSY domain-containing protein n=1 Tax=Brevibacillus laterosporus TaxID=1465 RepID=A0A518V4E4_BRELA|nr:hypothetical protein EEL30_05410 [Brevibacillus laterosporus]
MKAALDGVYAQFPETKSYAITGASFLDRGDSSWYIIVFRDKASKDSITFRIDAKTGEIMP